MFLQRLYTEPADLFNLKNGNEIIFVNGLNFIFGRKDTRAKDAKVSLNSIGKSTLLDFLDFCLLASFNANASPRLFSAREYLQNHTILLDFSINEKPYTIRRSFAKHNIVEFCEEGEFKKYLLNQLKSHLGHLLFHNESYQGIYSDMWLRPLLSFYLKIQKTKKPQFNDPISYLKDAHADSLIPYHLFLLGIDNSLSQKIIEISHNLHMKDPAISELRRVFKTVYGMRDLKEVQSRRDDLFHQVSITAKAIKSFRLAGSYQEAEDKINELTRNIKDLKQQNFKEKRLLQSVQSSDERAKINTEKVEKIFSKVHLELGMEVKKSLDEAISFRKILNENQIEMMKDTKKKTEEKILLQEKEIEENETERANLMHFLSEQNALTDFEEGIAQLNVKRKTLSEMDGQLTLYHTIINEKARLEIEEKKLELQLLEYVKEIQPYVGNIASMFAKIYNALYPEQEASSLFSIHSDSTKNSKVAITVKLPGDYGTGKNQGRTLIYDLTVLLNAIHHNFPGPRFMVHDGIFDTVDKAHFIELCNFVTSLNKSGYKFQYIVTLNEEGTLSDSFGRSDLVLPEQIERKAIAVLTPVHTLLGISF